MFDLLKLIGQQGGVAAVAWAAAFIVFAAVITTLWKANQRLHKRNDELQEKRLNDSNNRTEQLIQLTMEIKHAMQRVGDNVETQTRIMGSGRG